MCSVGTNDPWNAAGIGLDIRTLAACGVRPVTVVAGVCAQDADGVHALAPVPPELIDAQFAALSTARIAAYRIGALLDAASVDAVNRQLASTSVPVVYDPVLAPSGGGRFADDDIAPILGRLLPHVTIVTPNLIEAAALTQQPVRTVAEMIDAAETLVARGAAKVLITGGHLSGRPVDVFFDGESVQRLTASRIAGSMRGTGCVLAASLAAALAHGRPLPAAITQARKFVRRALRHAVDLGPMRVAY